MNIEVKLVDRCRLKSIIIDTYSRVVIREVCFLRVLLNEIDRRIELHALERKWLCKYQFQNWDQLLLKINRTDATSDAQLKRWIKSGCNFEHATLAFVNTIYLGKCAKQCPNVNLTIAHSKMGPYFFSYLLTWEVDLIEILEIMPQMWQYVIFLSLKPTKVTSDFILN